AEWDALDGVREAPFLAWAFLETLESTKCVCEREGWLPHHLTLWEKGELVAAAPAYLKDNSEGEFVFDWAWAAAAERARIRYCPKIVVSIPFTPATGARLLVKRAEDRARLVPVLAEALRRIVEVEEISGAHVLFPREDEARGLLGAGFLHRLGTQFHWNNRGY